MAIRQPEPAETSSATDKALLDRLRRIPGARVTASVSPSTGESVFEVAVDGDADVEFAVYRAEQDIYQAFPGARFHLYVV